jgi:tRNA nucleotidyltransferase (CCA-adding enzyme)
VLAYQTRHVAAAVSWEQLQIFANFPVVNFHRNPSKSFFKTFFCLSFYARSAAWLPRKAHRLSLELFRLPFKFFL